MWKAVKFALDSFRWTKCLSTYPDPSRPHLWSARLPIVQAVVLVLWNRPTVRVEGTARGHVWVPAKVLWVQPVDCCNLFTFSIWMLMMHLDGIDDGQNSDICPPGQTASSRSIHIAGIISWCGSLTSGRDEWIQSFLSSHSYGKGSSTVGCYFSMWGSIVSASSQSLDQNPWGTLSYHLSHSGRAIHFRVTYTWVALGGFQSFYLLQ